MNFQAEPNEPVTGATGYGDNNCGEYVECIHLDPFWPWARWAWASSMLGRSYYTDYRVTMTRYVKDFGSARANTATRGGVPYEKQIIRAELVTNVDTAKFIPIIRDQASANAVIPTFMGVRLYVD